MLSGLLHSIEQKLVVDESRSQQLGMWLQVSGDKWRQSSAADFKSLFPCCAVLQSLSCQLVPVCRSVDNALSADEPAQRC